MSMCDVPAEDLWTQPYEDLLRHWRFAGPDDPCSQTGTARADRYQQAIAEAHESYALFAPCCYGCWCSETHRRAPART